MVRQIGVVTTIPMILVAGPLVGFWIGQWLDRQFHVDPWGKTIFPLLGFAASLRQIITIIQRWIKETQEEEGPDSS